jgi:hypothetical protein
VVDFIPALAETLLSVVIDSNTSAALGIAVELCVFLFDTNFNAILQVPA